MLPVQPFDEKHPSVPAVETGSGVRSEPAWAKEKPPGGGLAERILIRCSVE